MLATGSLFYVFFALNGSSFFLFHEVFCFILELMNGAVGFFLGINHDSPYMDQNLFIFQWLHQILSVSAFFYRKFQFMFYFYYFMDKNPFGILMPVFLEVMFIVANYYYKIRSHLEIPEDFNQNVHYLIQSEKNHERRESYKEIVQSLVNGEYLSLLDTRCSLSIQVSDADASLLGSQNPIQWVIVENYLVDVARFIHPIG